MPNHKIGFVLIGGVKRLAAHVGALYRYKLEEDVGKIMRPTFVIGSSSGSIPTATCFAPWHHKNIEFVGNIVRKLTRNQILSYHFWMESAGVLTIIEDFILPLLPEGSTKTKRMIFKAGKSGLSLSTKALLVYELLEKPSLFSNKPLQKLLKDNMNRNKGFEFFWKSGEEGHNQIKLEIPAVDLVTAGEWIFTNYLPEHRSLADRDEFLIKAVLASASIPALFPTQELGNMVLDDAALRINAPLHRAVAAGCDVIFIFLHTPFHEKVAPPKTWIEEFTRALEITVNESTRKTVEGHQETNQCLEVSENIKRIVAKRKDADLDAEIEKETKKYPFYNRKKTILIPVVAEERLPEIFVGKFKKENMELGMEIGYRAMGKALETFYKTKTG
ncbi:MAG: patatin-like phospholipase family protein [Candidatus Yanofskybacteria bacterium]|nr:patatin-like phospholipase family protein [Candidatus Yanofskybacteria bacterium]